MYRFPDDFPAGRAFQIPPRLLQMQIEDPIGEILVPSGTRMRLLTRYQDVRMAFTDERFSRALLYPDAPRLAGDDITSVQGCILNLEGDEHTAVRTALSPLFSRSGLDHWEQRTKTLAFNMLSDASARANALDLVADYARRLVANIGAEMLGVHGGLIAHVSTLLAAQTSLNADATSISGATRGLTIVAEELLRRPIPEHGLLRGVARAWRGEGRISHEAAVGTATMLLFNAIDPLWPPIVLGILKMLEHHIDERLEWMELTAGDQRKKFAVVDEVLRFYNNGPINLPRVTTAAVDLPARRLEQECVVLTSALAASWDPEIYSCPEIFDPTRPVRQSLVFGAGRHRCLGADVARRIVAAAIHVFCGMFPHAKPTGPGVDVSSRVNAEFLFAPSAARVALGRPEAISNV